MRTYAFLLLLAACREPGAATRAAEPLSATPPASPAPVPARPEDPQACLDRVLREAGLNAYGDPPGTMYAGGSPLFDESTGRSTPLRDYVKAKHPELVARCPIP